MPKPVQSSPDASALMPLIPAASNVTPLPGTSSFEGLLDAAFKLPPETKQPTGSVTQTTSAATSSAQRGGTSFDTSSTAQSTTATGSIGNGFSVQLDERRAVNETTTAFPNGSERTSESTVRDTGVGLIYRLPLDSNSALTGQLRLGELQINNTQPTQNVRAQVGATMNIPLGPDTQINLGVQARYTRNLQAPDSARIQGSIGVQQTIGSTSAGPITASVTLTGRTQENNLPAGTGGGVGGVLVPSVTIPLEQNLDLTVSYGKGSGVNTDPTDGPAPTIIPVNGASSSSDVLLFTVRSKR